MKSSLLFLAAATLLSTSAFAANGQPTTTDVCFNRAQLVDAGIVSLVKTADGLPAVKIENRGSSSLIELHAADIIMIDGQILEGDGVTVAIQNGVEIQPAGTTVSFKASGLVYTCHPAAQN